MRLNWSLNGHKQDNKQWKQKRFWRKYFQKLFPVILLFSHPSWCIKSLKCNKFSYVLHITCAKVWNKKEVMSINKLMSTFSHLHFMFKHEPKCVGFGDLKNWIRKKSFWNFTPHESCKILHILIQTNDKSIIYWKLALF